MAGYTGQDSAPGVIDSYTYSKLSQTELYEYDNE